MLQRLQIVLAQVQAANSPEKVLNKIHQICYLFQAKEVTQKLYKNIMALLKVWNKMGAIFMNFENRKTSKPYRLSLNLADKINLKKSNTYIPLSNLNIQQI